MAWTDLSGTNFEEKMLWACVLRRAIFDYVLYKGAGKHKMKWQQANRFIFGDGDEAYSSLSFDDICGLFGWEPDYLRRKVRELDRHDIKKLEAGMFKDTFDGGEATLLTETAAWGSGQPVPKFAPFNYSREVRAQMSLRCVARRAPPPKRLKSIPPMGAWAISMA